MSDAVDTSTQVTADPDAGPAGSDDRDPVAVTHAPSTAAQVVTVVAALAGAGLMTPFTVLSIPFGIAGLAVVTLSVVWSYSTRWLSVGVSMILIGALLAGSLGALSPEVMLVGVGAVVFAWDAGQHGIVLGEQLGRATGVDRTLFVHLVATAVALALVSSVGYAAFLLAGGGRPAPAVGVVVLGIVVLAWSVRR